MKSRFWFAVKNTQGICFPWRCEAPDEREAYRQLWEEHKDELTTATRITEREALFRPYQISREGNPQSPTN